MRPLRRTILQFSQMRLTLERTFMTQTALPSDAALRPVATGELRSGALGRLSIQIGIETTPRQTNSPPPWPTPADTPSGPDCPGTESGDYMRGANLATSKAARDFRPWPQAESGWAIPTHRGPGSPGVMLPVGPIRKGSKPTDRPR